MKIQEGKQYVMRNGTITGKMLPDPLDPDGYPFRDPDSGNDYTATGKYWKEGIDDGKDLVSEHDPTSGNG